jgi:hypothetical protein
VDKTVLSRGAYKDGQDYQDAGAAKDNEHSNTHTTICSMPGALQNCQLRATSTSTMVGIENPDIMCKYLVPKIKPLDSVPLFKEVAMMKARMH